MDARWRRYRLWTISFLGALLLSIIFTTPSFAHWADLAVAEVMVEPAKTQITLTFPTGLIASSDDNRDGQLSRDEFLAHQTEIQKFLGDRIHLTDGKGQSGNLAIAPSDTNKLPPNLKVNTNTHTTLILAYTWQHPLQGLRMHYDLFLPAAPAAHCLATIFHLGKVQNFIFSRQSQDFWLLPGSIWQFEGSFLVALVGALLWGAMHAMTPGHGKTIVGAYLVGSRTKPQDAVFLGLIVTLTHTIGVFTLGLVTLFASHYILPEQILPWLSILSGIMVVVIGLNLFFSRLYHHDHHHHHDHDHDHDHHHDHDHSHLDANEPVTWRSLLALGISGGLVPCPSALVLLLSAIATGRIGFGLVLVLAFSLGLASVLTGLGLLLVYAKRRFEHLPKPIRLMRVLPTLSALFISLLGLGITTQALIEIGIVKI